MKTRLLTLIAGAILCAGPAAWAQTPPAEPAAAPPAPAVPAETAAPADTAAPEAPAAPSQATIPPAPAGKGQIVFFRPTRFIGAAVSYKLSEDGKSIGKVSNGKYLVVTVEPGAHTYVMDFGTKGDIRLEIEPDETYYLECGIAMGAILNHPNLIPSNLESFEKFAVKGKPQKK